MGRIVLRDQFLAGDGTQLAAHTPNVGGPWVKVSVTDNQIISLKVSGRDNQCDDKVELPTRGIDASFTVEIIDDDAQRLVEFRWVDASLVKGCFVDISESGVQASMHGDDATLSFSQVAAPSMVGVHHVRVVVDPRWFRVYLENELLLQMPTNCGANLPAASFVQLTTYSADDADRVTVSDLVVHALAGIN